MINYLKWLFNLHTKRPLPCEHTRVRCVHGDEINHFYGKRSVCLDCHLVLAPLPEYCYYTKEKHLSFEDKHDSL